jgi:hypothetical protein
MDDKGGMSAKHLEEAMQYVDNKSSCKCEKCDRVWRPMCFKMFYSGWFDYSNTCARCPVVDECMKKSIKLSNGYKYEDWEDIR